MHDFIKKRKWAPAQTDTEVAGITWIELFALFDLTGNRREEGQHQHNPAATRRAEKRREKARGSKSKKSNLNDTTVITKPTLGEELKTFKAIVRRTTKYEAEQKAAKWFTTDNRARLRRLGNLGVNGHQPSILAYCKMTKEEKKGATES